MLNLVKRWSQELSVPLWSHPTRDMGRPGVHWSPEGDLVWRVSEDGGVALACPFEVDPGLETVIVRSYLRGHLEIGEYSGLPMQMEEWRAAGGWELVKRAELLRRLDRAAEEVTGLSLSGTEDAPGDAPGPARSFGNTIAGALTDNIYDKLEYHPVQKPPSWGLYQLRYGAFVLAQTSDEGQAERYRQAHREL